VDEKAALEKITEIKGNLHLVRLGLGLGMRTRRGLGLERELWATGRTYCVRSWIIGVECYFTIRN
jgi:hypothetical protein